MVKLYYDENNKKAVKIVEDYYRYKYLLKPFYESLEKETNKYRYYSDKHYKTIENALKNNIWSYSQDDINFIINTTEMICIENKESVNCTFLYFKITVPHEEYKVKLISYIIAYYEFLIPYYKRYIKSNKELFQIE